jgi:nitroimidazol reductase NimA-like FMN-containing flavoprotein (pyridoxamine 5'-phosphate oxidase superfamily)
MSADSRRLHELDREASLALLGTVSFGRVVFTMRALPAIRPVSHLLDDGDVIIRTQHGAALVPAATGTAVVAYEADEIDPVHQVGWSVIVTGRTELVGDEAQAARYRERLRPWVAGQTDLIVRIRSEIVTGYALVAGAPGD